MLEIEVSDSFYGKMCCERGSSGKRLLLHRLSSNNILYSAKNYCCQFSFLQIVLNTTHVLCKKIDFL